MMTITTGWIVTLCVFVTLLCVACVLYIVIRPVTPAGRSASPQEDALREAAPKEEENGDAQAEDGEKSEEKSASSDEEQPKE